MQLKQIYFSPTATTRKIVETIASAIGSAENEIFDLTLQEKSQAVEIKNGAVIFGIPVYAGRVPEVCLQRLAGFSAAGVPAVLVALYGNREYEDALIELNDVVSEAGFKVIAAAAFIGEHSYSTTEQPIAVGRPDKQDLEMAQIFGRQVAEKLAAGSLDHPEIAGDRPYRERVQFGGIAPITNPVTCTLCGRCAEVCPTFVIDVGGEVITRAEDCLMCCACAKNCPTGARAMVHPVIQERRALLIKNCSTRKEPSLFL
ncbi:4Fe-4S dicluster domain-containing protein [Malonomonas rubra DSM 5091]|uniref:4Fe-4S dicluster domain-containing protein n=1 Tax=Malonomonas rubra DSM 5091 TaxID=1122189 RepID=A0A1M6FLU6_MALRU|nr:4Fe-4S binding protein [Malonomonas rubra]SHI98579.1 4Fe-4S dicluster domain-containing protein [Malonomonas rubra DSM 5091]